MYEYLFNGLVGAPIHEKLQHGAKVLEFCWDSDLWITEVAAEYPNTKFYVVDFNILASNNDDDNITFIKCELFQKLPFPDDEFDYIFCRDKFHFFEKDNFYYYLSDILRILKPGGWLEIGYLLNHDINNGPATKLMMDAWQLWLKSHNVVKDFMENFEKYLQDTGKVESILHQLVTSPIGGIHDFGEFSRELVICYMKCSKDYLVPFMNISTEVFDSLVSIAESEMRAKDCDMSFQLKRIIARKKIPTSKENGNYTYHSLQ
ncbi:28226_t:CDS:2 [Gigaspora margarita]|uniref:28226_t:CDS:1 n=1 Tax=Gigaspora margarita TaxID=4874 RepID=A0ABN7V557_GIGMA|nr:28226_t:CDS:2 [Gigaspora margarita]